MKELNALYLEVWPDLTEDEQKRNFQQIIRYFVSPLSEIQDLKPVERHFKNERFRVWEVVIDGLRYVFVPGKRDFLESYDWDSFCENNQLLFALDNHFNQAQADKFFKYASYYTIQKKHDPQQVSIDPFLVSVDAIPVSGQSVGYYDLYDGRQIIDSKIEMTYRNELTELFKTRQDTPHFFLQEDSLEKVAKVFKKSCLQPGQLMENFAKRGVDFISADEYYYLKSGGMMTFFPWGDVLDPATVDRLYYVPNRFGIKIKKDDNNYLLTDNPFRYLEGPVSQKGRLTKYVKYASFFDSGFVPDFDYFKEPIDNWQMEYRPVIRIKID
ncbi:hypothetical protein [Xylocopilactobacillus apicola]|uniref:Uncharacterized protein n=1 Tax=Xylocopilactobacillus apicola TaxID=2932184 RepID=A0AAU9D4Z1_9LACO|nr:hypothetical protein [Xylocopilactobacillus apicola]BDR58839.1 hypothetical protein XA3_12800 [Xylocopilactobacillus apicola]